MPFRGVALKGRLKGGARFLLLKIKLVSGFSSCTTSSPKRVTEDLPHEILHPTILFLSCRPGLMLPAQVCVHVNIIVTSRQVWAKPNGLICPRVRNSFHCTLKYVNMPLLQQWDDMHQHYAQITRETFRHDDCCSLCSTRPYSFKTLEVSVSARQQTITNSGYQPEIKQNQEGSDLWFGHYIAVITTLFHHCDRGFIHCCNKIKCSVTAQPFRCESCVDNGKRQRDEHIYLVEMRMT